MGCICNKEDRNDYSSDIKSIAISEHKMGCNVGGISLETVKGDILKTKVDCMIVGTDLYLQNRNSFKKTEEQKHAIISMYQQYRNQSKAGGNEEENDGYDDDDAASKLIPYGDAIETFPNFKKKSNIQSIISISLPLWKGGQKNELKMLEKGIQNAYLIAQKYKTVGFTDIASTLFGYTKQDLADIFIRVSKEFMMNKGPECQLEKILIVLRDDKSIYNFEQQIKIQIKQEVPSMGSLSVYEDDLIKTQKNKISSRSASGLKQKLIDDQMCESLETKDAE